MKNQIQQETNKQRSKQLNTQFKLTQFKLTTNISQSEYNDLHAVTLTLAAIARKQRGKQRGKIKAAPTGQ